MTEEVNRVNARKGDLIQGDVGVHLVRLTVPMVWGLLAVISFQLADTYFVSLLGTKELAAISFTFPVTFIVFSLMIAMNIATASVVSRQIGKGNWSRVRRLTTHAVMLAGMAGLVLGGLGILLNDTVFHAIGATEELLPMIRDYTLIWFGSAVFMAVSMVGNSALRAAGETFFPAAIMIAMAIVNIILDPILIFGLFGAPKMGIQGAAVATAFGYALASVAVFYVLVRRKKMVSRSLWHFRLFADSCKRFGYIALPVGLTNVLQPTVNALLVALLARAGHESVAAFGVASRIEAFSFIVIMALAIGMGPIIGQNWGAGKYERVHAVLRKAFAFTALWSFGVAVILGVFAHPIASIFSRDESVIVHAVHYFWIVPLSYIPGNLAQGWASAFNAVGMPRQSFAQIVIRLLALQVPLALAGFHFFGEIGVFGSIALTNILVGAIFYFRNWRVMARKEQPLTGFRQRTV